MLDHTEAIMTTRKHKLTFPPPESPTEQLKLMVVTAEQKPPARTGQIWQAARKLPVTRSLPHPGKITLH